MEDWHVGKIDAGKQSINDGGRTEAVEAALTAFASHVDIVAPRGAKDFSRP